MFEICLYYIDVCIRETFVLERCVYWRGFCIREVSVLERTERCPY